MSVAAEKDFSLEEAVMAAVRESSRQGRPATRAEVLVALAEGGLGLADQEQTERVEAVLASHPGIASLPSLGGETVYHDPELLSRTYARIVDRKAFPLALMAEEIRLNARDYPRPVPVELFEAPPFDLTPEEIGQTLQAMAASPEYEDITYTTATSGAVYLFSTRYLERQYANFLAESADALVMNP